MSDSYRKPYWGNSKGSNLWKAKANRKIRRSETDIGNNKTYKKMNNPWAGPMDTKHLYSDDPKMRRK
jgi:hypothetical protein